MAPQELQPLSIGSLLDLAVRITRQRFRVLVTIVLVVVVPVEFFSALIRVETPARAAGSRLTLGVFLAELAPSLLVALAAQLASAACLKSVTAALFGEHASWQESLEFVWSRFASLFAVIVAIYGLSTLALTLFIVPGVYLWISWLVAMPVLLLEGRRGFDCLGRSRELVRGRWWPTFGTYLLASILVGIVANVVSAILLAITGEAHAATAMRVVLTTLAGSVGGLLATPFLATVIALIYLDLRVRKEGFHLSMLPGGEAGSSSPWPTAD